jgi:hypothetical protein
MQNYWAKKKLLAERNSALERNWDPPTDDPMYSK